MAKIFLLVVVLGVLSICSIGLAQEPPPETAEITLTTYYPAPYGDYAELTVSGAMDLGPALSITPTLNAITSGDVLTAVYINPSFNDSTYSYISHNGLIVTNGNVGIGTTSPVAKLEVVTESAAAAGEVQFKTYSSYPRSILKIHSSKGTQSSPLAVSDGNDVGELIFTQQLNSTTVGAGAQIGAMMEGTPSGTSNPVGLRFQTTPTGSTVRVERMRIDNQGNVGIGTTEPGGSLAIEGTFVGGDLTYSSSTGTNSFAWGNGANATGNYSIAMGNSTTASGYDGNIAMGSGTTASGLTSTAMGINTTASGTASTAMGNTTTASGWSSTAIGYETIASGNQSIAAGLYVTAGPASNNIVFGRGANNSNRLVNNIPSSLMVGFNSTIPTLFVGPGSGAGTLGNVGIGTTAPENKLHVNGAINLDPIAEPAAPTTGFVLYVDSADGDLKARSHNGIVTTIAND